MRIAYKFPYVQIGDMVHVGHPSGPSDQFKPNQRNESKIIFQTLV